MQHVSAENMKIAIGYLFNKIGPASQSRPQEAEDLDRYAAIASFMTDEMAFKTAMTAVATELENILNLAPEKYALQADSGVMTRRVGMGANKIQENKALIGNQDFPNPAEYRLISEDLMIRTFRFRPLLQELERTLLGTTDNGRVMFGDPGDTEFGKVLRAGEVWKDSIAFNHGEYTHRLQWLAIAKHFEGQYAQSTMLRLYKCSGNPIKSAVRGTIEGLQLADKKVTISGALWNFLVDCFPTNDQNGLSFCPDAPITGSATTDPNTFKYAGRADSFRSPDRVMAMLRKETGMTIIHSYVTSSYIKIGKASLSGYRRNRLQDKVDALGLGGARDALVAKTKVDKKNVFVLNQFLYQDGTPALL